MDKQTIIDWTDIFLVSSSVTGRSHMLGLLSEYLSEKDNLMSFYGDVRYFEFKLNYCKSDERFTEIQRLMTEVISAAGFRNEYKGIIYIDIDEWVGHCHEKHFIDFLEYLSDNSDNWLVVLSVNAKSEEKVEEMLGVVTSFLRIECIKIEAPTSIDLADYLCQCMSAYNISVDAGAREILFKTVETLSQAKYFDGYKTVKMLAQDIVYNVLAERKDVTVISEADVLQFSNESEYVKRYVKKIERTRHIGF